MKWLNERKWAQYLIAGLILLAGCCTSALILWHPWTIEKHTVTYYGYDGQVSSVQTVQHGKPAQPPTPEDTDILFRGWEEELFCVTADMEVHPVGTALGEAQNIVCANAVYAMGGKQAAVTPMLTGTVACSEFTIQMAYDAQILEYVKAEPILEGLEVTQISEGVLELHWSSEENLENPTALAHLRFRCLAQDSCYETTLPLLTKEIYTQVQGQRIYTDSTAYDGKLYIYNQQKE